MEIAAVLLAAAAAARPQDGELSHHQSCSQLPLHTAAAPHPSSLKRPAPAADDDARPAAVKRPSVSFDLSGDGGGSHNGSPRKTQVTSCWNGFTSQQPAAAGSCGHVTSSGGRAGLMAPPMPPPFSADHRRNSGDSSSHDTLCAGPAGAAGAVAGRGDSSAAVCSLAPGLAVSSFYTDAEIMVAACKMGITLDQARALLDKVERPKEAAAAAGARARSGSPSPGPAAVPAVSSLQQQSHLQPFFARTLRTHPAPPAREPPPKKVVRQGPQGPQPLAWRGGQKPKGPIAFRPRRPAPVPESTKKIRAGFPRRDATPPTTDKPRAPNFRPVAPAANAAPLPAPAVQQLEQLLRQLPAPAPAPAPVAPPPPQPQPQLQPRIQMGDVLESLVGAGMDSRGATAIAAIAAALGLAGAPAAFDPRPTAPAIAALAAAAAPAAAALQPPGRGALGAGRLPGWGPGW
jgi:hypothetical protein